MATATPFLTPGRGATRWTALLLGLMLFLVAATGVPAEELLQDSWKSMLVGGFALGTGVLFLGMARRQGSGLRWHPLLALPILLACHALSSMAWSHTYLAAVEFVRWLLVALLMFLAMQLPRETQHARIFHGAFLGATAAALWCVLQFVRGFDLFPQAAQPASTFVNRNFLAEFLVTCLPLSAYLCGRSRRWTTACLLGAGTGMQVVAILMAGTRTALVAGIILAVAGPWAWRRLQVPKVLNGQQHRSLALACALAVVACIGSIPTGNPKLIAEIGQVNSLERGLGRGMSSVDASEYRDGTMGVRFALWQTTSKMIAGNPWMGVGAGAWEVLAPLYQSPDTQIETDYYAHNEYLQLGAEYGLVGWIALGIAGYFLACPTVQRGQRASAARTRTAAWLGLLALAAVSLGGFPWHLAGTCALLALLAGICVSGDARPLPLPRTAQTAARRKYLHPLALGQAALLLCSVVAVRVAWLTAEAEFHLIRGVKQALAIANSRNPGDVLWNNDKERVLKWARQGIAITPHYRKITPLIADAMARWGDWEHAVEIWGSVLGSRPHVVVIMGNLARGHVQMRDYVGAQALLDRAFSIRPQAPNLLALQVIVWHRTGKIAQAAALATDVLNQGAASQEMVQAAYALGVSEGMPALAERAMLAHVAAWPQRSSLAWMRLGRLYSQGALADRHKAIAAFRSALSQAPAIDRPAMLAEVPVDLRGSVAP